MKKLLIALLFIAASVSAQPMGTLLPVNPEGLIEIPAKTSGFADFMDLVAEKAKESKGAYTFTLDSKHGGALYLPMYTMHSKDKKNDYLELGVGGQLVETGIKKFFISTGMNIPALSKRLWRTQWRKDHVRTTRLPPIWIGPFIQMPTGTLRHWKFRNNFGVIVSIALGAPWK